MGKKIVGTCGNCGGPVTVPLAFLSVNPPKPACDNCNARPRESFGPVLDMQPKPRTLGKAVP